MSIRCNYPKCGCVDIMCDDDSRAAAEQANAINDAMDVVAPLAAVDIPIPEAPAVCRHGWRGHPDHCERCAYEDGRVPEN